MPDSSIPSRLAVAGLVAAVVTATAAPLAAATPAPELAQQQLQALNHRLPPGTAPAGGRPIEALTHADFLYTRGDGAWLSRAEFIAQWRQRPAAPGATVVDEPVRLFGPVALVHGLAAGAAGRLRYTDVYLWGAAGWQLVSAQDTPLKDGVGPALVTAVAPVHAAWQGQDPAGEPLAVLIALNEHYVRSFREADVAWYDAHLAPDYVVIAGDGAYRSRSAALATFALPTFATSLASFPVDRVQVRRFGDVALIHASNVFVTKDGRSGESRYTDIWHHQGGQWRCIAAHITAHRLPAAPA